MNKIGLGTPEDLTDDAFLGGKLQVLQPRKGYRAAMDAVLLAAAVGAKQGDHILDVGAGVGVVSLCLARRIEGIKITGLERQEPLVAIALENARRNNLAGIDFRAADLFAAPKEIERNSFDWVVTNPPYYQEGRGRGSPDPSRKRAHMLEASTSIADWITAALKFVRPLGNLATIFPADELPTLIKLLEGPLGALNIFPLWPGGDNPARRVIIIGTKGSKGKATLLPGLELHEEGRRYSEAAEAVLCDGKPLKI